MKPRVKCKMKCSWVLLSHPQLQVPAHKPTQRAPVLRGCWVSPSFFSFFLNLCIQKSLALSILCSPTWQTEHGLFTQNRKRKVSNNWAPLEAGQWGTNSRAGHQEPGWDLSSSGRMRSDVPILNRSDTQCTRGQLQLRASAPTTNEKFVYYKESLLNFFVFISFHIGMRPP